MLTRLPFGAMIEMYDSSFALFEETMLGVDLVNELRVDRGDKVVVVMVEHRPKTSCKRCLGRGHMGKFIAGPEMGLLMPCRCIGRFEEVKGT